MTDTTEGHKDFHVSWDEFYRNGKALAWRLESMGPWAGVVAVTRGGMVPACVVARELKIPVIETFCITSYEGQKQGGVQIHRKPDLPDGGKGWVVIDDLVDTGTTFRVAREHLPQAHYACVYATPMGVATVDTYITEVSQDTWIHLPWEV